MGASYAAREGGTSTAEAPEGQQQQEQQEQQPASQQMFQVCLEYRVHLFRAASTESIGVLLEGVTQRILRVYEQYYRRPIMATTQEYIQSMEPGNTAAYSSKILSEYILYTISTSHSGKS